MVGKLVIFQYQKLSWENRRVIGKIGLIKRPWEGDRNLLRAKANDPSEN